MPPLLVDHRRCCRSSEPEIESSHDRASSLKFRSWQDNGHTAAQPLACTTITWGISVAEPTPLLKQVMSRLCCPKVKEARRGPAVTSF